MLVFEEREKPEFPEKNLTEQSREPTNSVHILVEGERSHHCANPAPLQKVDKCVGNLEPKLSAFDVEISKYVHVTESNVAVSKLCLWVV